MLRALSREIAAALQLADVVVSAALFVLIVRIPHFGVADAGLALLPLGLAAALVWPISLRLMHLYDSHRRDPISAVSLLLALAALSSAFGQSAVAFATGLELDPTFPIVIACAQLGVLGGLRIVLLGAARLFRRAGHNTRNVLIAGSGPRAAYVEDVIARHPEWGLRVIGFIDGGFPERGPAVAPDRVFPLDSIDDILADQVIDEVIVAVPRSKLEESVRVVDAATSAGVPITLLSDVFGDLLPTPRVKRFGALPALAFAPVHHPAGWLAVKRAIDAGGAAVLLLAAAPVLALCALAIKLTSPGPVFFHQVRCTLNGRLFSMPKLRTMLVDAEEKKLALAAQNEMSGPVFKMRSDPRITPVGRFLRRYSLDELPQLWSVLRGDMSLVGPRPAIPSEVAEYRTAERRRLSMRPGLTCLWQVSGRNKIGFEDWVRLDLEYIDTWSLASDFTILLRTLPAVLRGEGAS
ncbi:MAG: sugar transferase [Deltaproteobacteria bacterium]|nr:sugar transferase [Deltaproteobacteria bacterium]